MPSGRNPFLDLHDIAGIAFITFILAALFWILCGGASTELFYFGAKVTGIVLIVLVIAVFCSKIK